MNKEQLLREVTDARSEIKTTSLDMSIGELISLYQDGDIILNPSYQRVFRWEDEQKSRFIESIILGIPLPPIFAAQDSFARWTIVDGLQRLSTIFQLVGVLNGNNHVLKLFPTKKLKSIHDLTWDELPIDIQRIIKRAKLSVYIMDTGDSIHSQFELFQRLNTGGIHLTPQEIRNCLMLMLNQDLFNKFDTLKDIHSFKQSMALTSTKKEKAYEMECILRYFILKKIKNIQNSQNSNLSEFIDEQTENIFMDSTFNFSEEAIFFTEVFDLLHKAMGKDAFKKFTPNPPFLSTPGKFSGGFNITSFEMIIPGVCEYFTQIKKLDSTKVKELISDMYRTKEYASLNEKGLRAVSKMFMAANFSHEYFKNAITSY